MLGKKAQDVLGEKAQDVLGEEGTGCVRGRRHRMC